MIFVLAWPLLGPFGRAARCDELPFPPAALILIWWGWWCYCTWKREGHKCEERMMG